jgi:hypothetical protein
MEESRLLKQRKPSLSGYPGTCSKTKLTGFLFALLFTHEK